MNISISADAVAWYGAILATATAIAGGFAIWRDRGRLKVSVRPNVRFTESFGHYSKDRRYMAIEAVNAGRRPMKINFPHFKLKGKSGWLCVNGPWQPNDYLAEGEVATIYSDDMQEQYGDSLSQIKYVMVKDATGRTWKGRLPKA